MHEKIYDRIRRVERDYQSASPTKLSSYTDFSLRKVVDKIEAYLFSRHITGEKDSLGRKKPFFNVGIAIRNIWYRATDIDRKHIRIKSKKQRQFALSFLASVVLWDWMKKARFGVFLNEWGRTLATFGSAMTKWIEKDGELIASVVPWNRLIIDPVDENNDIIVERLELTPADLRRNPSYDQELVEKLIGQLSARTTTDGVKKDTKQLIIPVYEAHGDIELAHLTDDWGDGQKPGDSRVYTQQVHVVSFVEKKDKPGEYDEYTLYRGKEKNPYMLTHLIKEDGRVLAIGAFEHTFEAQWMINHSQKSIKDQIELSSKMVQQTSDDTMVGKNIFSDVEVGDILFMKPNTQLIPVQWNTSDVSQWMNFQKMWEQAVQGITSTPDAVRGTTMPSGTPYSLGAYLGEQGASLFEQMVENKGLAIEDMMRTFIIPFLKKKLDTTEEIAAVFDSQMIQEIDSMYVPNEAIRRYNKNTVESVLNGELPSPYQKDVAEGEIQQELAQLGNQRFFKPSEIDSKTWKEAFKDFEWEAEVEVTGETVDKQAMFTTLSAMLSTIATNPAVLSDPNARLLFNTIAEETGRISPLQLSSAKVNTAPPAGRAAGEPLQEIAKSESGK